MSASLPTNATLNNGALHDKNTTPLNNASLPANATLSQIAQALLAHDEYVIVGHVSPDGDCLGSQLALMHALHQLGKQACCVLATDATSIDASFLFLPGIDMMIAAHEQTSAACVIALDVPSYDRMGASAAALHKHAQFTITIDHHQNDKAISHLNYIDSQAASTTLLVWQLLDELSVSVTSDIALCTLTGLITDTGGFQYQNTDAFSLRCAAQMLEAGANLPYICTQVFQRRSLAALKLEHIALDRFELLLDGRMAITYVTQNDFTAVHALKTDADNIINALRNIDGVIVACVLRENAEDASIRGSLRAKDTTDVSAFAVQHNGGGHKAAAGMTLKGSMQTVYESIKQELMCYLLDTWKERSV